MTVFIVDLKIDYFMIINLDFIENYQEQNLFEFSYLLLKIGLHFFPKKF